MKHIGREQISLTNRQLAAGKGTFVSDIRRENMTHMAVVRSPHASARIKSIDSAAAEAVPGVVKVVTGREIKANMNPIFEAYDTEAMGAKGVTSYALCPERVRYVGEAVAAVVAEDKYTARKAADLVAVEYETTPIVSDTEAALQPDSPLVEPDWGDNILITRDFV
ncbi:MAG TPA: carbon monoxide dehydrogenase, partial [Alphaproteobacteria bacterium]|nr:carbon monoxide dehydrogenase [Alphaproteobacteria bacterium]